MMKNRMMNLKTTYYNQIQKLAQSITNGVKKLKLFPYPDMKAKLDASVEEAVEAKYLREQADSRKATK